MTTLITFNYLTWCIIYNMAKSDLEHKIKSMKGEKNSRATKGKDIYTFNNNIHQTSFELV